MPTVIIYKNPSLQGDVEKAKVLVDGMTREEVDAKGFGDATALHVAVMRGHLAVVSLLAAAGADLSAADVVQYRPLHYAAWHGRGGGGPVPPQLRRRHRGGVQRGGHAAARGGLQGGIMAADEAKVLTH